MVVEPGEVVPPPSDEHRLFEEACVVAELTVYIDGIGVRLLRLQNGLSAVPNAAQQKNVVVPRIDDPRNPYSFQLQHRFTYFVFSHLRGMGGKGIRSRRQHMESVVAIVAEPRRLLKQFLSKSNLVVGKDAQKRHEYTDPSKDGRNRELWIDNSGSVPLRVNMGGKSNPTGSIRKGGRSRAES